MKKLLQMAAEKQAIKHEERARGSTSGLTSIFKWDSAPKLETNRPVICCGFTVAEQRSLSGAGFEVENASRERRSL